VKAEAHPRFGSSARWAIHARQTCAIAAAAFGAIVKSAAGIVAVAVTIALVLLMPVLLGLRGVQFLPATAQALTVLTAPVADNSRLPWVLIPLLIVFYAGELIWRERDAGMGEMSDAAPTPEWVLFTGKFLGLSLVLAVWMALMAAAGVFGQMRMGYFHPELGLYLKVLFGLQLIDYLLFALLAFVAHAVVNQKQVGYLVALIAYGVIAFPSTFGLEHHLLIYGSGPSWTYSDMRGFGPSLAPWLWFRLYWAAWALLLAIVGTLLWGRGVECSLWPRLRMARRRLTRAKVGVAAAAVTLIVAMGGVIFYNTNVLNRYRGAAGDMAQRAKYERRYGKYSGLAQPTLTSTSLRVEIYPERREAEIRGVYVLENNSTVAIASIHLTTAPGVETRAVSFERAASAVLVDDDLGYRIYALSKPLEPGGSLHLRFEAHAAPHGFGNDGADAFIVRNGSHFTNRDWLPAIGYRRDRELNRAAVRKQYGLGPRRAARPSRVGGDPIAFDAIVGTSPDQVALAPGVLRRTWTENGRRYFHYAADVPINNEYGVFSARYALREEAWTGSGQRVAIQIFHHPGHSANLGRMMASVRASLDYYTRQFGPYPYSYIRLIESPGAGVGVETEAATIEYHEGFSLLNPGNGPQKVDAVFAVIAHGVARGWWGMQVAPADAAGSGLLNVSLETYSAMRVIEESLGAEHLRRYLTSMREQPGIFRRAAPPLLHATDPLAFSRKGPFALYALSRYIGAGRVNDALRSLLRKYGSGAVSKSGAPWLATSADLYRELQAVTPDSYRYLLRDLFEKNTFWELATQRAAAKQIPAGGWAVTLDVRARKVAIDEAGIETEEPMDDWIEAGVFGKGKPRVEMRRIHSGEQTITIVAPGKPARAGIDPDNLLIDLDTENNMKDVTVER
jgi:ABC-type transport system involved in multi-copper enzyme maturation permease subunit